MHSNDDSFWQMLMVMTDGHSDRRPAGQSAIVATSIYLILVNARSDWVWSRIIYEDSSGVASATGS